MPTPEPTPDQRQFTALRAGLRSIIRTLPLGEQDYIEPLLNKTLGRLSRKEYAEAIEAIQSYPCPSETLQAARAQAVVALEPLVAAD